MSDLREPLAGTMSDWFSFASRRASRIAVTALVATGALATAQLHTAAVSGNIAENGFSTPVLLPDSHGGSEPSIAVDSQGRIFVTAVQIETPPQTSDVSPTKVLTGTPVWRSTDGGASFAAPVRSVGVLLHGEDADLAIDSHDDVYQADLWLGNVAMSVSTDNGQTFTGNEWGNLSPVADRPWLAYSPHDNVLYDYWGAFTALHVARSLPLVTPAAGLAFPFDEAVVTECGPTAGPCLGTPVDDRCSCPPGGIATDPTTGEVYITYGGGGDGGNVGVAYSTDEGGTWTKTAIPGSGSLQNGQTVSSIFQPIKVDSAGNVYVAWAESLDPTEDSSGNIASVSGVAIRFSRSTDHGRSWSTPVTVSTTTGANVFPALAIPTPGTVDVGYYGTAQSGSPGLVPDGTPWDLMVATSRDALSATPTFAPQVAVSDIHEGCIVVFGAPGCSTNTVNGNGLGDFFEMATSADGTLYVAYVVGGATTTAVQILLPGGMEFHTTTAVFGGDVYVTSRR